MRTIPGSLASLALCLLSGLQFAQQAEVTLAGRVDAVLETCLSPRDSVHTADQLARLGMPALGSLLERLQDDTSGAGRKAALLVAIGSLPREGVLAFLSTLALPGTGESARITALDLVARFGGRPELKLAVDLAAPLGVNTPPAPGLLDALVRAFVAISSREAGAPRDLVAFFGRVEPAVQTAIVAALRHSGRGAAPVLLAGLLGRASEAADALVLSAIAESARQQVGEDLLVFERVRGYLGHPNRTLAVMACYATRFLVDDGAVPDLIILLCEDDSNVRRAAHAALGDLTGLNLAPEPAAWMSWLNEGLTWWEERADGCRVALASGTATDAAAALQELARQRLFLREVIKLLALALRRDEPDLVQTACRVLAGVPASAARAALHTLSALPDSELTRAARRALARPERKRPSLSRAFVLPRTRTFLP